MLDVAMIDCASFQIVGFIEEVVTDALLAAIVKCESPGDLSIRHYSLSLSSAG